MRSWEDIRKSPSPPISQDREEDHYSCVSDLQSGQTRHPIALPGCWLAWWLCFSSFFLILKLGASHYPVSRLNSSLGGTKASWQPPSCTTSPWTLQSSRDAPAGVHQEQTWQADTAGSHRPPFAPAGSGRGTAGKGRRWNLALPHQVSFLDLTC